MVVSLQVTSTCLMVICSAELSKMKCIYSFFACNIPLFLFVFVCGRMCVLQGYALSFISHSCKVTIWNTVSHFIFL
jgi:hypothetical protein